MALFFDFSEMSSTTIFSIALLAVLVVLLIVLVIVTIKVLSRGNKDDEEYTEKRYTSRRKGHDQEEDYDEQEPEPDDEDEEEPEEEEEEPQREEEYDDEEEYDEEEEIDPADARRNDVASIVEAALQAKAKAAEFEAKVAKEKAMAAMEEAELAAKRASEAEADARAASGRKGRPDTEVPEETGEEDAVEETAPESVLPDDDVLSASTRVVDGPQIIDAVKKAKRGKRKPVPVKTGPDLEMTDEIPVVGGDSTFDEEALGDEETADSAFADSAFMIPEEDKDRKKQFETSFDSAFTDPRLQQDLAAAATKDVGSAAEELADSDFAADSAFTEEAQEEESAEEVTEEDIPAEDSAFAEEEPAEDSAFAEEEPAEDSDFAEEPEEDSAFAEDSAFTEDSAFVEEEITDSAFAEEPEEDSAFADSAFGEEAAAKEEEIPSLQVAGETITVNPVNQVNIRTVNSTEPINTTNEEAGIHDMEEMSEFLSENPIPKKQKRKLKKKDVIFAKKFDSDAPKIRGAKYLWYNNQDIEALNKKEDMYYHCHYFNDPEEAVLPLVIEMYDCAFVRTEEIQQIAYGIRYQSMGLREILTAKENISFNRNLVQKDPTEQDLRKIRAKWCDYVDNFLQIIVIKAPEDIQDLIHDRLYEYGDRDVETLLFCPEPEEDEE